MPGFKAVITYWNPKTDCPNGYAEIEGRRAVVSIEARGALQRTRQVGIYEDAKFSTHPPSYGEKIFIPFLQRYVWRSGGKRKGYGYYAPCWVRSA
jgi:hypothetical protein